MNKTLLAIASLCAFSLSACQSSGGAVTDFAQTYRLHTPDGVIETSDPKIIAAYASKPGAMIVPLGETPAQSVQNAQISAAKPEPAAP